MFRTSVATGLIAASDLLLLAAITGVGLLFRRLVGPRGLDGFSVIISFWVGFSLVVLSIMAANFIWPISDIAMALLLVVGAVGLLSKRHDLVRLVTALGGRDVPWVVASVLLLLWVANASLAPLENWDSALYHLQAIRWSERYAVVPGIANLFGPLGFNNASFLYGALLNAGPWQDKAHSLTNGVLVYAVLLQGLLAARALWRREGAHDVHGSVLVMLLVAPAVVLIDPVTLPSYITDGPTTLTMVATMPLLVFELRSRGTLEERGYGIVTISMLLSLAVCMKLHIGVFAAIAWPLAVVHWWRGAKAAPALRNRTVGVAVMTVALFAGLWMGRGVVQSGYPFFPIELFGLPVDWRAPAEHAAAEHAFILHSGRNSSALYGVDPEIARPSVWLPRWWNTEVTRNPYELLVPIVLIGLASLGLGLGRRRGGRGEHPEWLLLIPVSAALVAWFLSAPAPRYAMYLVWTVAAIAVAGLVSGWLGQGVRTRRATTLAIAVLVLSPAVAYPALEATRLNRPVFRWVLGATFNRPPEGSLFWEPPAPSHTVFQATGGLQVNVPLVDSGGRCWSIPIPCTPNPAPNLERRDPDNLAAGFRVSGSWQMRDWPYLWLPLFLETFRADRT